jgi:DNA-directed RNA polymerase subunit RPC12/RpoP
MSNIHCSECGAEFSTVEPLNDLETLHIGPARIIACGDCGATIGVTDS